MADIEGKIVETKSFRGNAPKIIAIETSEGKVEVSTFDGALFRIAANNLNRRAKVTYVEKPNKKDADKPHKNMTSMELLDAPVEAQDAPGSTLEGEGVSDLAQAQQGLPVLSARPSQMARVSEGDALARLEMGFRVAVRQRELLEGFIKSRFRDGEHFMDGKVFGSKKPVLLQPGAQLILYGHGYALDFEVLSEPDTYPTNLDAKYNIQVKAVVKNSYGRVVGTAIGSAGSHVWSGRSNSLVPRAADPEKVMNTVLKMAQKRALVTACNNCTASSEFFTVDLEDS